MLKSILFKEAKIAYEFYPHPGKTCVVLLHGFLESRLIWEEYIQELHKKYSVLALDLLGHGASECTGYVHSMEEMAEALQAVLKEQKLRRVVLVGHSLGGYVALAFADKNPDAVKGLCLFNSTALADPEDKKQERERTVRIVKSHHSYFITEAVTSLYTHTQLPFLEDFFEKSLAIALKTPKQGIIAALEGMKIRENRELLVKFAPFPVFYVIGKKDKLLPYKNLIEQALLNENGTYYLSEEGGHLCFFEDKLASLNALIHWIGKLN